MTVKPSTKYFKNENNQYECKICHRTFDVQNSAIRHSHDHPDIPKKNLSKFTYNDNNILLSTERLLLWKASHGIAMEALEDPLIINLLPDNSLMSRKTNQNIIDQMSSQIIELNYEQTSSKKISLILDGGTLLHQKWLAIGFLYRTDFGIKFNILDVQLFDKATSEAIKQKIQLISERINHHGGEVVGVCTDNASNFCKAFLDSEDDSDFVPLGIVRVSCACHTVQLCLKDLYDEDSFYRNFVELIKIIPTKISYLKREQIKLLGIASFPPHQSQRWNSVFITLQYIIRNIAAVSSLFTLNELAYLQLIDLFNLAYLLLPVHIFTTTCEADNATQSTVYVAYRGLKESLKLNRSKRARLLLDIIKKRFKSTADISISKLCYFTTNAGLCEKQERYPHVSSSSVKTKNDENAIKFDKEIKFIVSFRSTIQKICNILSLDFECVFAGFKILMENASPENNDIHKYPGPIELRDLFLKITGDDRSYIQLSNFLDVIQILPASEASAERIFARMRDIYNKKQTQLSVKSLRSNLILSFHAQKIRTMDCEIENSDSD